MKAKVSIVKCSSYDPRLIQEKVRHSIELIGGIASFIKPESRVLIKPNLLMAKEPECGITTHPEVVRAAVKLLKEINCKVFIGDGPSAFGNQAENVDEVYERTGIKKVAEEENAALVKFENKRWRKLFPLTTWIDQCDHIVNIPKFKTHNLMVLTGAIKNLYGFVWGTHKTELHKKFFDKSDFSKILVDIFEEVKPALNIVDGVVAMEADGPATCGKLREVNLLIAGTDAVAVDSVLSVIMGLLPSDILTTKEAAIRGLGVSDIKDIEILGESLSLLTGKPFILPSTSWRQKMAPFIINMVKGFIKYYPYAQDDICAKCSVCVKACPNKAITMKNGRIVFDYSKCISCFCCQEFCPSSAIKVKKSAFAKMIGL